MIYKIDRGVFEVGDKVDIPHLKNIKLIAVKAKYKNCKGCVLKRKNTVCQLQKFCDSTIFKLKDFSKE